jgi:S1-C subfamily serine protease
VERVDRSAADLIVAVDDQKVATAEDFLSYIEEKRPGDEVSLTIVRDGKRLQVELPLTSAETQAALKD